MLYGLLLTIVLYLGICFFAGDTFCWWVVLMLITCLVVCWVFLCFCFLCLIVNSVGNAFFF